MSLIDQQKDLESFSDQSLLQEAQQPMRGYPPYLVMAEIQRRQQDRQRVERQMAAQQEVAPPVAQQQAAAFAGQLMQDQAMAAPQGITAAMPAQAGMEMGQPQMALEAPMEAAGIMDGMPVQGMAGGGEVKRMQTGKGVPNDPLYRFGTFLSNLPSALTPRRSEVGLRREIATIEAAGGDASALRAELASMKGLATAPAIGQAPVATPSSAPGITSVAAAPRIPGIANIVSGQVDMIRGVPVGGDTAVATPTAAAPGIAGVPVPRGRDLMSTYRGLIAEMTPLETMQSQAKRFDPGRVRPDGTIASDPFFVEEAKRLESFRPSKEDFERMSRAELLAGLGAVIGGATQRGDIARGLAQLTQQQRQAQRDFRREEREFAGFESNLRREERAEVRAAQQAAEALRQRERQEGRETSRDALAIANAIESNRLQQDQLMANIRNLNLELQMAKEKARKEGLNAQLKLLIDTMEMRLKESQINLNNARAKQLELGKLGGFETATAASDVF